MPPQSTTTSHSTSPRSVRTRVTRSRPDASRVVSTAVTRVRCAIVAPPERAMAASAVHSRAGSTWPSVGV
jgi:hypothetical protein